jgi:hypothetical protein
MSKHWLWLAGSRAVSPMTSKRKADDLRLTVSFGQIRKTRARDTRQSGELSARRKAINKMLGRPDEKPPPPEN